MAYLFLLALGLMFSFVDGLLYPFIILLQEGIKAQRIILKHLLTPFERLLPVGRQSALGHSIVTPLVGCPDAACTVPSMPSQAEVCTINCKHMTQHCKVQQTGLSVRC